LPFIQSGIVADRVDDAGAAVIQLRLAISVGSDAIGTATSM
jgi:hypothetical protein